MTANLTLLALLLQQPAPQWTVAPELPFPTTNNAVVAVDTERGPAVFSFLGLDSTKRWSGIHARSFRWAIGDPEWSEVQPVPGRGRLAATAQAVAGRIYLFGGYTVDADGSEKSLPNVDIYDPDTDTWNSGAAIPIPVDDAVSGVWADSLCSSILLGGVISTPTIPARSLGAGWTITPAHRSTAQQQAPSATASCSLGAPTTPTTTTESDTTALLRSRSIECLDSTHLQVSGRNWSHFP